MQCSWIFRLLLLVLQQTDVQHVPLYLALQKFKYCIVSQFILTTGSCICGDTATSKSPFKETGVGSVCLLEACAGIQAAPELRHPEKGRKAVSSRGEGAPEATSPECSSSSPVWGRVPPKAGPDLWGVVNQTSQQRPVPCASVAEQRQRLGTLEPFCSFCSRYSRWGR